MKCHSRKEKISGLFGLLNMIKCAGLLRNSFRHNCVVTPSSERKACQAPSVRELSAEQTEGVVATKRTPSVFCCAKSTFLREEGCLAPSVRELSAKQTEGVPLFLAKKTPSHMRKALRCPMLN